MARRTTTKRQRSRLGAKLIVGLGNPGHRYVNTRHNVGYRVADRLVADSPWQVDAFYHRALVTIRSRVVHLLKPTTSMNDSGKAVVDAISAASASFEDVLVLVDDIHIDVGRTRVRRSGSEGGHNGLRSIAEELRSDAFARVRLGVGSVPKGTNQIEYVLGSFDSDEVPVVDGMIDRGAEAVRTWCGSGIDAAMNAFNGM